MVEALPCHSLFFVVWDSGRGGGFRVLPEQHTELYDLVSKRVQIAINHYRETHSKTKATASKQKCDRQP